MWKGSGGQGAGVPALHTAVCGTLQGGERTVLIQVENQGKFIPKSSDT